jgi:subtilisin family serine protease
MKRMPGTRVLARLIAGSLIATAPAWLSAASDKPQTYLVRFTEPGVTHYTGGVAQLNATAAKGGHFNAKSNDVQAYRSYLSSQLAKHVGDITSALGHAPDVTHTYQMTRSGLAARFTAAEAAIVANVPGVASVELEQVYTLATYRGPTFIGADTIWNASPSATNRGRGIVIGELDGGTNSTHPSFANDASCGFSANNPKLASFRDCSAATNGMCDGPQPEDTSLGHGVHTASTAAGNTIDQSAVPSPTLPQPFTQMSGVAPCASIRSYRVCPDDTCPDANILAGIDNILLDGDVSVVNFSISGGTSPWGDHDRDFLDLVNAGIFVASAAGNLGGSISDPVGQVNHLGPWMMTVAAVTHDAVPLATFSIVAPDATPTLQTLALDQGSTTPVGVRLDSQLIHDYPANIEGCTASGGFPNNYFAGSIALIRRGTCPFTEKITNAYNAGAELVIVGNNQAGAIHMDTTGAPAIPAYSISSQSIADELIAYVEANAATVAASFDPNGHQGDRLADFSLRGPTPAPFSNLTKPDIAAPGVQIYAALNPENGNYGYMSGTSMATPHIAGAAALLRATHPQWTPMQVKSAMQLTAKQTGVSEDGVSAWTIDDVGSGRADLSQASRAGLVMDESYSNFLAANPRGGTIALTDLNLPSLRNVNCPIKCTFTRTLTSTLNTASTWTTSFESSAPNGISVKVSPSTFSVGPGGSATITVSVNMGVGDPLSSRVRRRVAQRNDGAITAGTSFARPCRIAPGGSSFRQRLRRRTRECRALRQREFHLSARLSVGLDRLGQRRNMQLQRRAISVQCMAERAVDRVLVPSPNRWRRHVRWSGRYQPNLSTVPGAVLRRGYRTRLDVGCGFEFAWHDQLAAFRCHRRLLRFSLLQYDNRGSQLWLRTPRREWDDRIPHHVAELRLQQQRRSNHDSIVHQ